MCSVIKLYCDPESNSTRHGIKLPLEFSMFTIAVGKSMCLEEVTLFEKWFVATNSESLGLLIL